MKPSDFIHSEDAAALRQMESIPGFAALVKKILARGIENLQYGLNMASSICLSEKRPLYHFINRSLRTAACFLLIPFLSHGNYDTIAFGGVADPYIGSISTLALVYVKMHNFDRTKIVAQIEREKNSYNAL